MDDKTRVLSAAARVALAGMAKGDYTAKDAGVIMAFLNLASSYDIITQDAADLFGEFFPPMA
jgi:hypothetical protein